MKMQFKKSQMEIMGLAVVVILITLGIFFVIQFIVLKEPSQVKKTYTQTQSAANLLNSMLKTTTKDCIETSISQLLQDCVAHFSSETNQILCEDGNHSCKYVNNTIKYILNNTLIQWGNQAYDFEVYTSNERIINLYNGDCSGEKESKQNFIQTDVGIMTVKLDICG
jgi:hypothetical protein